MERSADNREVLRSNRNGPITFGKSEQKPYHTRDFSKSDFARSLKHHKSLSDKTIEDHLRVMESFLASRLPMDDFLLHILLFLFLRMITKIRHAIKKLIPVNPGFEGILVSLCACFSSVLSECYQSNPVQSIFLINICKYG